MSESLRQTLEQYRNDVKDGSLSEEQRTMLAHLSMELLLLVSETVESNKTRISIMEDSLIDLPVKIADVLKTEEKEEKQFRLERKTKIYLALIAGLFTIVNAIIAATF